MTRRQPQRVPPPLDHGTEVLDAGAMLDELTPDTAPLLWKTVRAVRLWARLGVEERKEAFLPSAAAQRAEQLSAAGFEPAVLADLQAASSVLEDGADGVAVAAACRRIAEWAEREGALATALEFMQAASFADPTNASHARSAGLIARMRAEYARSETWFRHAIAIARRTRDWPIFVRSYLGIAKVHLQRGNLPAARKSGMRALRAAKRYSMGELVGMAYHDLTVMACRADRPREVAQNTRAALEAYGNGNPLLATLAYDVAVFWMTRGHFAQALTVFEAIPAEHGAPATRLRRAAAIVRSAGAIGNRESYGNAWRTATRLLSDPLAAQAAATALLNMAKGAGSAGELDRAIEAAEKARALAAKQGEAEVMFAAEAVLESARAEQGRESVTSDAQKAPPREVGRLATDLAAALVS